MKNKMESCYYHGRFCSLDEVAISPTSRIFLFGEGLYSSLKILQGRAVFFPDHLERIKNGMKFLYSHLKPQKISEAIDELRLGGEKLAKDFNQGSLRLNVWLKNIGREFVAQSEEVETLVIAYSGNITKVFPDSGVAVMISSKRKMTTSEIPSYVKMPGNYAENFLELKKAKNLDCQDAIFLSQKETVADGTTSSVILIQGNKILIPEMNPTILEGITRKYFINWAKTAGYQLEIKDLFLADLMKCDSACLLSSVSGVRPIANFNFQNQIWVKDIDKIKPLFEGFLKYEQSY